jgi:hypothetical protein
MEPPVISLDGHAARGERNQANLNKVEQANLCVH